MVARAKDPEGRASFPQSAALHERAVKVMPGGVSSPVRSFKAVGGTPPFIRRGEGAHVVSEDGRRYVDYVLSYGPLILGHAHPEVRKAIHAATDDGTTFGAPTAREVALAEAVTRAYPAAEMVRFVSSGTEATMSALRLARAATGRDGVIKFQGCYHGHADAFLIQAGSGGLQFGVPSSPGVTAGAARDTFLLPFNDADALRALFRSRAKEIACAIVEPVVGNTGVVQPAAGFLDALRRETESYGALLIFDEVMTGFRVAWGGVASLTGIRPDLVTLGKVIGGGLPLAAYGGRRDLMERIAPSGPVYQAGTLSGNPLATAAGLATIEILRREDPYALLAARTERLARGMEEAARRAGVPLSCPHETAMFSPFFSERPPRNLAEVLDAQKGDRFPRFFHALLDRGIYVPPSAYEAWFLSTAHTDAVIDETLAAVGEAILAAR